MSIDQVVQERSRVRLRARLLAIAVPAVLLGLAGTAQADNGQPKSFVSHGQSNGLTATPGTCPAPKIGITGGTHFGLDLDGVAPDDQMIGDETYVACVTLLPGGAAKVEGTSTFTGKLLVCSAAPGTLKTKFTTNISAPDPVTQIQTTNATATILSGAGGLANVDHGRYTVTGTVGPGLVETGLIRGTVYC